MHFPRSLQGVSTLLLVPFEASQGSLLGLTHTSGALLAGSFPDAPPSLPSVAVPGQSFKPGLAELTGTLPAFLAGVSVQGRPQAPGASVLPGPTG